MKLNVKHTLLYDEYLNSETNKKFLVFLVLLLVFLTFFQPFHVVGISMEPTLIEGHYLLSSKTTSDYNTDNIIVFNYNDNLLVKRIVGIEGDLIEIIDNKVHINSSVVEGSDVYMISTPFSGRIPKNSYYVLGDNLSNSMDSRCFGLIHKDDIIAKILFNFNKLSSY